MGDKAGFYGSGDMGGGDGELMMATIRIKK
jgi:hypothetical protein